jgi:hypothetical protein
MAYAKKDLTALNSTVVLDVPGEMNGIVSLQYHDGAAGTVVVEGTLSTDAAPAEADWESIKLTRADDKTEVDNLAAAGIAYAENFYNKVRARKSVGVASCFVTLGVTYG